MSQTIDISVIRRVVESRLPRKAKVADDTRLVSGGLIDSMSLVDLIMDLESATGVRIPVSEVEPDDFDSIDKITATVRNFVGR